MYLLGEIEVLMTFSLVVVELKQSLVVMILKQNNLIRILDLKVKKYIQNIL